MSPLNIKTGKSVREREEALAAERRRAEDERRQRDADIRAQLAAAEEARKQREEYERLRQEAAKIAKAMPAPPNCTCEEKTALGNTYKVIDARCTIHGMAPVPPAPLSSHIPGNNPWMSENSKRWQQAIKSCMQLGLNAVRGRLTAGAFGAAWQCYHCGNYLHEHAAIAGGTVKDKSICRAARDALFLELYRHYAGSDYPH